MFINIHTHFKPRSQREVVVRNAFSRKLIKPHSFGYYVSTGIHPWEVGKDNSQAFEDIQSNLNYPEVIAIGECGLDRMRGPEMLLQTEVFLRHIELANQFSKPLILHLVRTYSDILEHTSKFKTPWIVHGFKGNVEQAEKLISKGARLSFGAPIMTSSELQNVLKILPLEHLYFETDNKPIQINDIYEYASKLLAIEIERLEELLEANFERDFSVSCQNI